MFQTTFLTSFSLTEWNLNWHSSLFRCESYIDFCTQCVIMTLVSGVGAITNDVLKFRKVIKFERLCIVICFSYIYLIIDGKNINSLVNKVYLAFISNTWYYIIPCPDFRSEVSFFLSALLFLQSRYLKISEFRHHHFDVVDYYEKYLIKYVIKLFNTAG